MSLSSLRTDGCHYANRYAAVVPLAPFGAVANIGIGATAKPGK